MNGGRNAGVSGGGNRGRRIAIALLVLAAAAGAVLLFSPPFRSFDARAAVEALRSIRHEWWAIPAYVLAYALLDVLFIPAQPLSVAAPLVWGWAAGGTIEWFAATAGALLPYLIARSALRERLQRYVVRHERIAALLEKEGFSLLLVLRVVPIIPYTLLNYLAPLSNVRPLQYVVATAIGIIPSTFIFAYFVDAVAQGLMSPADVGYRIVAAGVLLGLMIVATRLIARSLKRRLQGESRTS